MKSVLVGKPDAALERLLQEAGVDVTRVAVTDLTLLAQRSTEQPDVVIVDLRYERRLPPEVANLTAQHPSTRVIIITTTLEPGVMLEALRAGVKECLVEPVNRGELQAALARVCNRTPGGAGQIFAFVGAKGGVGTTTIAVNVAAVLAQTPGGTTLLLELQPAAGDAAMFLGVCPRYSLSDALENTSRLDAGLLDGLVARSEAGVDLLAAPRVPAGPIDARRLEILLHCAARHYRFIVVDVARTEIATLTSATGAASVVLVTSQELGAIHNAQSLISFVRGRGHDRIGALLNRFDKRADITTADVQQTIGVPIYHVLPNCWETALDALNHGRPLVLRGRDMLGAALTAAGRSLAGVADERRSGERIPHLLGRFIGRRAAAGAAS
jgi:pilus assembly protein CpaE